MLAEQGGTCAVCKAPPKNKRLHVDHDHETGAIRGLLCVFCNTTVGRVEDQEHYQRILAYLQHHKED